MFWIFIFNIKFETMLVSFKDFFFTNLQNPLRKKYFQEKNPLRKSLKNRLGKNTLKNIILKISFKEENPLL